jgi:hypothetical protein
LCLVTISVKTTNRKRMSEPLETLKVIRFCGEMLPQWAQLLDLAARICSVPEETRGWFSRLTNSAGVDDARTVRKQVGILQSALLPNKQAIITELQRTRGDGQASRIFAAWEYALDTIAQQASSSQTCSWLVEGVEDITGNDFGGGDITLRRV